MNTEGEGHPQVDPLNNANGAAPAAWEHSAKADATAGSTTGLPAIPTANAEETQLAKEFRTATAAVDTAGKASKADKATSGIAGKGVGKGIVWSGSSAMENVEKDHKADTPSKVTKSAAGQAADGNVNKADNGKSGVTISQERYIDRWRLCMLPLSAMLFCIPLFAIVLPVFLSSHQNAEIQARHALAHFSGNYTPTTQAELLNGKTPALVVEVTPVSIDPFQRVLTFRISKSALGKLHNKYGVNNEIALPKSTRLVLKLNSKTSVLAPGDSLNNNAELTVPMDTHAPYFNYPRDKYAATITITAVLVTGNITAEEALREVLISATEASSEPQCDSATPALFECLFGDASSLPPQLPPIPLTPPPNPLPTKNAEPGGEADDDNIGYYGPPPSPGPTPEANTSPQGLQPTSTPPSLSNSLVPPPPTTDGDGDDNDDDNEVGSGDLGRRKQLRKLLRHPLSDVAPPPLVPGAPSPVTLAHHPRVGVMPMHVKFGGITGIPGFHIQGEHTVSYIGAYPHHSIKMSISRSSTSILFSVFVVTMMWLLSICFFLLAVDFTLWRPRKSSSTVCSFGIAMSFALPVVRNVQPLVPPIGIGIDFIGFFWNMALVCMGVLLMLSGLAASYKDKHAPPEPAWINVVPMPACTKQCCRLLATCAAPMSAATIDKRRSKRQRNADDDQSD